MKSLTNDEVMRASQDQTPLLHVKRGKCWSRSRANENRLKIPKQHVHMRKSIQAERCIVKCCSKSVKRYLML